MQSQAMSCVRQVQQIGHGDGDSFTQVNNNIPLFDRQDHPFVPTCLSGRAPRAAAVKDAARERGGTGAAGAKRP
jgi:hypothetical protein